MPWGRSQKSKALVARFVAATNAHDIAAMRELVSEDFTYIDSWREGVTGRDTVMLGVERLFDADPGFRVEVETVSFSDPFVLMRGWANSALPAFGRRRAVWRARCESGFISEWQSWAEGGPPAMNRTYSPEASQLMADRDGAPPTVV
ncbi:nuclear transport factor 2 family protein [Tsuneonella sp. YG55]|uniref:Nuclear transport factor 2 family protein n=1 Tax=Tsuneonella litorea TaxID=2976475 RepID=A0A9X2VZP0_9SPHN|nr:nuclear transport factor 2 family protein [Tsuneonella litorea]MCT2558380.1 nuclear transport factor 2 family protein [Tsuneonella litorea]